MRGTEKVEWRKASASGGGNCVEVGLWFKASVSGADACLEVAPTEGGVAMRDSKHPEGPVIYFTKAEFAAFIQGCSDGEFDELVG